METLHVEDFDWDKEYWGKVGDIGLLKAGLYKAAVMKVIILEIEISYLF